MSLFSGPFCCHAIRTCLLVYRLSSSQELLFLEGLSISITPSFLRLRFGFLLTTVRVYKLLLARLMGQYCFARGRLLSVVVVCNAAGWRAGRPSGAWLVGRRAGRVGGRAADTARRASTVTSC